MIYWPHIQNRNHPASTGKNGNPLVYRSSVQSTFPPCARRPVSKGDEGRCGRRSHPPHGTGCDAAVLGRSLFPEPQRNILITPGSDSGLFYAMFPFLEPGDEVLIPDPSYPNNTQNATLMGAVAVHVPLCPEDGYRLPVEEFRRLCTDRTKMVVLTNPNNPTSTVFSKAEISELCRLIDGTGAPAVEQGYLLVEDGMIRSVGAIQDLQGRRKPESTQPDCAQPDGNRGTFPESGWSLSP